MDHDHHEPSHRAPSFWRSRYAIGLVLFAATALFFLLSEHRAHTLSTLPYLLLAASPFLHIFMHRGHGHGHSGADEGKGSSDDRAADAGASKGRPRSTQHHH